MANKLTSLQLIKLSQTLQKVCSTVNGKAVYGEGWSDIKVLETMGQEYVLNNVKNLRKHMFGEISKPDDDAAKILDERLDALQIKIDKVRNNMIEHLNLLREVDYLGRLDHIENWIANLDIHYVRFDAKKKEK